MESSPQTRRFAVLIDADNVSSQALEGVLAEDILRAAGRESEVKKKTSPTTLKVDAKLTNLLRWAVEASEDEEGWANLGTVGAKIMTQQPDFDARSYGFGKLSSLVAATEAFEVERETAKSGRVDILIRELPKPVKRRTRARR